MILPVEKHNVVFNGYKKLVTTTSNFIGLYIYNSDEQVNVVVKYPALQLFSGAVKKVCFSFFDIMHQTENDFKLKK